MFSSPSHFGTPCSSGLASWVRRVKEGKGRRELVEESTGENERRERGGQGTERGGREDREVRERSRRRGKRN